MCPASVKWALPGKQFHLAACFHFPGIGRFSGLIRAKEQKWQINAEVPLDS